MIGPMCIGIALGLISAGGAVMLIAMERGEEEGKGGGALLTASAGMMGAAFLSALAGIVSGVP